MDRATSLGIGAGRTRVGGPVLPSRLEAIDRLLPALRRGPVLISGEAGSGKTWLAGKLAEAAGPGLDWVEVDVGPSMAPADFFAEIAAGLGLDPRADRYSIGVALAESSEDGRPRALRVDEAQNASAEVLEEIRILDNRLGRADGFSAIVLVAQTSFVRRLDLRAFGGLETRLASHAHLMPIDADEAEILLGSALVDPEAAESLHRSAMGNPARLLRLARAAPSRQTRSLDSREGTRSDPVPGLILPSRPPLQVEEGVIEVGWDSEADPGESVAGNATSEPIRDPYATLQAQAEWAKVRVLSDLVDKGETPEADGIDEESEVDPFDSDDRTSIRTEGEQEFAPYSQLFARLKQAGGRDEDRG